MSFLDVCFQVTCLDDFWSDSGVSGTPKTSIWLERGSKNKFFTEVGILMTLGSILDSFGRQKGSLWGLGARRGVPLAPFWDIVLEVISE